MCSRLLKVEPSKDFVENQFVPFSPRHVMLSSVQPETDSSLQFPYNIASQESISFHSDVGQYSSQESDDELESIQSAIDLELHEILSACVSSVLSGNLSASCNKVYDENESSDDGASSVGSMSESDTDVDIDPERCIDSSLDVNPNSSRDQMNSASEKSIVEDWLVNVDVANVNNAFVNKNCKSESGVPVLNAVNYNKSCSAENSATENEQHSEIPSARNSASDEMQFDNQDASDNQSLCSQHLRESVSDHQSEVECECMSENSSYTGNVHGKHKMKKRSNRMAVAQKWNVMNISERCNLFEYKQILLNQQIPVHHRCFKEQVRV